MKILAEYKRKSPWQGELTNRPVEDVVGAYDADPRIWGVSIVVDPLWGGDMKDLISARLVTKKPILAKAGVGFDPELLCRMALIHGANFALVHDATVAARVPGVAWLEVHRVEALPQRLPLVVVANNRDLRTGALAPGRADEVYSAVNGQALVCAASGYSGLEALSLAGQGVGFPLGLIGTALLRSPRSEAGR